MMEVIKQPPGEIVKTVMQMLESRGIIIPPDHIDMTIAMMCHWLEKEKRGKEYMAYLQQLDIVKGKSEKIYKLRDGYGRLTGEIDPENIIFLRGCLIKGEPVPVSLVEIHERETHACESCMSNTVCTKVVKSSYSDQLERLCSRCMEGDEDLSLRGQVSLKCEDCSYSDCNWHPSNLDVPAYNPAI